MMHPRLRAGLVIAAVVVASAIAGAAIDRGLMLSHARRGGGGGGDWRRPPSGDFEARRRADMLERMNRELSLTPAQRAGLDSVFQRTDSSLRAIRREMQPRLKQVFVASGVDCGARVEAAAVGGRNVVRRAAGGMGWGRGAGRAAETVTRE
jgi:hypothetical protein